MLLKETIPNPLIDGVFNRLFTKYSAYFTWLTSEISHTLDMTYYLNYSGCKTISPMYNSLIELESKGTIVSAIDLIADAIKLTYGDNWNRLYKAFIEENYNPIENYSMTENEKVGSKVTTTRDVASDTYGFNSTTPVPTNEGTETSTTTGSKDDNNRELTRSGNIGVTTSQEMLESEINLRKWNFYNHIMKDIDNIICLQIYE